MVSAMTARPSLTALTADLAAGRTTSRALVEAALARIADPAGEGPLAGSRALDDTPPAKADAPIVARLKAAGAVIVGRTNMTEFAFSGVGINPHYGTPGNPYDRSLIPG